MNRLFIDTSSNEETVVGLEKNGKEYFYKKPLDSRKSQVLLPMIEKFLQKHQISLSDLTEIEINTGPGSFTGLRVGLSVANALSSFVDIPINNKRAGTIVDASYS